MKLKSLQIKYNSLLRTLAIAIFAVAGFCPRGFAQNITVDDSKTGTELLDALVTGNACSQFSNITVSGASGSKKSFGYFSGGGGDFPLESGIILSSGFASSAIGPNNSVLSDTTSGWGGDPDLEEALGISNTFNATVLEFDFIPFNDHISFNYLFSSEEYTNWNSQELCNYSDGFAFLLREAGSTAPYQNLAVIPGTSTPVKVTTVRGSGGFCPAANQTYFGAFNNVSFPTDFNGQTVVLTAEANVIPGNTYHIKLVIADQGDSQYDSAIFLAANSFNAGTELGEDRTVADGNPMCDGDTLPLDATTPAALHYQWYKDGSMLLGENNAHYTVTSAGIYKVEVQLTPTCSATDEIAVEFAPVPTAGSRTLLQCDDNNDGYASYNLDLANPLFTGGDPNLQVQYFVNLADAQAGTNAFTQTSAYRNTSPNQTIYVRLSNPFGCYDIGSLMLATSPTGLTNPTPMERCDDADGNEDGIMQFDLTQKDAEILQGLPAGLQLQYFTTETDALAALNPIANPAAFTNTTPGTQTVYARVNSGADCYGVAPLTLRAFIFGQQLQPESVILCTNGNVTLNGGTFATYSWEYNGNVISLQPQVTVTEAGTYTLTVTNTLGCRGTKEFTVNLSGIAESISVETVDFSAPNNTLSVTAQGPGEYEYSIDGAAYQEEPVFSGLAAGEYTVYVRDRQGCVPVVTKTVYILDYPRFFTPNGDGRNDVWRIPYLFMHPKAAVTIFDRYGKILASLKGNSAGWNGTYNGKPLPADDYWFVLEMEDGRTIKAHFSILR